MSQPGLTTIFPALVSRQSASFISVMKRAEPQITTIRGRLSSFFASASFSSEVSSCGYDTGSSWWCGPRGACGDENEGVQDRFVSNDVDTLATALCAGDRRHAEGAFRPGAVAPAGRHYAPV